MRRVVEKEPVQANYQGWCDERRVMSAEKRRIQQILRIMLRFKQITIQKQLRRCLEYAWYNVRWFVKRLVVVNLGLFFNFISLHVFVEIVPYEFVRSFTI